jgi:Domain of unknown function (DUF5666)
MAHLVHPLWRKGLVAWLSTLALAAVVIGCGGGGTDTAGGVGVGGTGAGGPVTGYGSIIVNGIHFEFGGARFVTEDEPDGDDQSDEERPSVQVDRPVGLGTVVSIQAGSLRKEDSDDRADASVITLISAIKGPISDIQGNTITILGQQVDVDESTQYAAGRLLADLRTNDHVVVYGHFDAVSGHYKATRVEYRLIPLRTYKVRGYITGLTATTITLNNGLPWLLPQQLRSSDLALGQLVRVRMLASAPNVAIVAMPVGARLVNDTQTRQDGVVSRVVGNLVDIDDVTVDVSQATLPPGGILVGSRLEVKGTVRNGVLVAAELRVDDDHPNFVPEVKLRGRIRDLSATQFTVRSTIKQGGQITTISTTVQYTANVIENQASLSNDAAVEVEGTAPSGRPDLIVATRIRLR